MLQMLAGKKREGSGMYYTIEEMAQRLEFEIEQQQEAHRQKSARLGRKLSEWGTSTSGGKWSSCSAVIPGSLRSTSA
jgi:hypothetical protein